MVVFFLPVLAGGFLVKCVGDTTTVVPDGGSDVTVSDGPSNNDVNSNIDTGTGGDAGDGGALADANSDGGVTLTVKNSFSWCSVSVNGNPASSAATQTATVSPGTYPLTATALTGFKLGLWHHTTGDTGSGDPGTVSGLQSSATVGVGNSAMCVWVCCPFTDGTGCPTTDQCP